MLIILYNKNGEGASQGTQIEDSWAQTMEGWLQELRGQSRGELWKKSGTTVTEQQLKNIYVYIKNLQNSDPSELLPIQLFE